jgi:hypothetical protein
MAMKIKDVIVGVVIGTVLVPLTAWAIDAVIDVAAIQAITMAATSITTAISTMQGSIVMELQKIQGVQNAEGAKVSTLISQASSNQTQRALDSAIEGKSQEAERNTRLPIDPCANAAHAMATPDFDRARPAMRSGAFGPRMGGGPSSGTTTSPPSTGSGDLDKSVQYANGLKPAPTPESQALLAQKGACDAYAAGVVRTGACTAAGTPAKGLAGLPNADVLAATLFDGAQTQADTGKVSLSFNDKQMAAAQAYLRNISNPVALRELKGPEANTDEGRRYLALRDAHIARLDMATWSMTEWVNNKAKYPATIPIIQAMLDGGGASAQYLQRQLPLMAPDWATNGVSLDQLMFIESQRRYENPDWLNEIATSNDQLTMEREQLQISAQIADLLTKNNLETRKTNVLLGAIYQASLNKDFMPELVAQFKKATSTR